MKRFRGMPSLGVSIGLWPFLLRREGNKRTDRRHEDVPHAKQVNLVLLSVPHDSAPNLSTEIGLSALYPICS